jgi:hypothetical protein
VATSWNAPAAEKAASFEGTVSASFTRGGTDTKEFLFTRKGNQLRIEDADKSKPEPINIVDLDAKKLTIIYPHNSTFVQIDLIRQLPDRAQMGAPNLPPSLGSGVPGPPGFPSPPNMNSVGEAADASPARTFPGTTTQPSPQATARQASSPTVQKISPPPGFPTPPPMPSMPAMPQMPIGGPPIGAGGPPALPNPGMMPAMGSFGGTPELKKTDKTKKIQGFDCTLYTISDRMETFEIWATADSALFPFRLLQRNYSNRRFGPRMLEEQWIELLQKQSLFPLEATLRMDVHPHSASPAANGGKGIAPSSVEHGQERLSFKVDKIDSPSRTGKKIDDEALFKVPEKYYEINAPGF